MFTDHFVPDEGMNDIISTCFSWFVLSQVWGQSQTFAEVYLLFSKVQKLPAPISSGLHLYLWHCFPFFLVLCVFYSVLRHLYLSIYTYWSKWVYFSIEYFHKYSFTCINEVFVYWWHHFLTSLHLSIFGWIAFKDKSWKMYERFIHRFWQCLTYSNRLIQYCAKTRARKHTSG